MVQCVQSEGFFTVFLPIFDGTEYFLKLHIKLLILFAQFTFTKRYS